jgi:ribonuclease III family protein
VKDLLEAMDEGLEASLLSPLQLAYIGDTVWDLMVRTGLLHTGKNLHNMHCAAVARVNAKAQAQALDRLYDKLTGEEADFVRRGRNAHPRHGTPRNQDPASYSQATGLETLIGYLYLTGRHERLQELFQLALKSEAVS